MPLNLEFKAEVSSFENLRSILKKINAHYLETIKQVDTYFFTNTGRLKIREINNSKFQLIYYKRGEEEKFRWSEYQIQELSDVTELKEILKKSLGIKGIVNKVREVFIYNHCRIHLDDVVNLGRFVEFEYLYEDGDKNSDEVINALYNEFFPYIVKVHRGSYIDMLQLR